MPDLDAAASAVGTLRLPGRIHFGFGVRRQLPHLVAAYGRTALVVVDPFLSDSASFIETVDALTAAGIEVVVHSDIRPELPVDALTASARAVAGADPDVVVAYGGGSAIDAAKLLALLLVHEGPLSRYYGENAVPAAVLPLIAVPTTAGTGSEVTPVAVVSDTELEMKVGISSHHLIPAAAVVDPELTLGAPPTVTAYAGIDALVHALESFTGARLPLDWDGMLPVFTGRNVLAAPLALEAVRHLVPHLEAAVRDGSDRNAREHVALGSLLAGMAFGPTGTHLSHALQYPIGTITKTPHGLGTGLMIPYVLQASVAVVPELLAELDRAMGGTEPDPARAAQDAVDRVAALCAAIGIPASLAEIGVAEDQLDRIAELALRSARLVAISPLGADPEAIRLILRAAHAGDRTLIDPARLAR